MRTAILNLDRPTDADDKKCKGHLKQTKIHVQMNKTKKKRSFFCKKKKNQKRDGLLLTM